MNASLIILIVLLSVMPTVVGMACYYFGKQNERKAWNKHLGLPYQTPDKPYFTSHDVGICIAEKATFEYTDE